MTGQETPPVSGEPDRRWTISDVRGRGSSLEKGLATVHSMLLQAADGSEFRLGRINTSDCEEHKAEIIAVAGPRRFDRCPICLAPDPSSDEHVPPKAIGGSVMTSTCQRCNNRFGSVLERALVDWWEDAIGSVLFSHESVRGARKTSRVLMRQKDTGEFALVLDGGSIDSEIMQRMIAQPDFAMTYSPPDARRYRLAALKSAYLGACLLTKSIPETPEAIAIRAELMAVRDLPRRARPNSSALCDRLSITKSQGPAVPGEIALVRTNPSDGGASEFAISLSRTLMVSWPIGGYLVSVDDKADRDRSY
ncbi:HNH endonuclease [Streptomyces sp. HYC2]|uniref:HNH endonuclease n=1 Tax=Streptomyces sp. HYC2 TaxID=2955207 RepID=UPI0024809BED|nr:HNH endonuclease [Streptomyces sp. HYC2]